MAKTVAVLLVGRSSRVGI